MDQEFEVAWQILQVSFFQPLIVLVATVFDSRSDVRVYYILSSYYPMKEPAFIWSL
jgi:hypothetical protein